MAMYPATTYIIKFKMCTAVITHIIEHRMIMYVLQTFFVFVILTHERKTTSHINK